MLLYLNPILRIFYHNEMVHLVYRLGYPMPCLEHFLELDLGQHFVKNELIQGILLYHHRVIHRVFASL